MRTTDGSAAETVTVRATPSNAPTSPMNEPGTTMSGSRRPPASTPSRPDTSTAIVACSLAPSA